MGYRALVQTEDHMLMFLQQPGNWQTANVLHFQQCTPCHCRTRRKFQVPNDSILSFLSLEMDKMNLTVLSPMKDTGDSFTLTRYLRKQSCSAFCVDRAFKFHGFSAGFKTLFVGWESKSCCRSSSEFLQEKSSWQNR